MFHVIVKCSWDGLPEGRNCSCVWSFWCSELSSIDKTATYFSSPFAHSGWVQFLESGEGCTNDLLSSPDSRLPSVVFWGQIWLLSWTTQLLKCRGWIQWWQSITVSAAPQLVAEVQRLLGLFHNGVYVIVPLQVLGDGGAQEPEWLHCSHSAVHDGVWGESRGFLLKSTIICTVLSLLRSRLLRLHHTASSLNSCL